MRRAFAVLVAAAVLAAAGAGCGRFQPLAKTSDCNGTSTTLRRQVVSHELHEQVRGVVRFTCSKEPRYFHLAVTLQYQYPERLSGKEWHYGDSGAETFKPPGRPVVIGREYEITVQYPCSPGLSLRWRIKQEWYGDSSSGEPVLLLTAYTRPKRIFCTADHLG